MISRVGLLLLLSVVLPAAGFAPLTHHWGRTSRHMAFAKGLPAGTCRTSSTPLGSQVRCAVLEDSDPLSKKVCERTQRWVEEVIVGYNICPFAMKPVSEKTVRYVVSDAADTETLIRDSWKEAALLLDTDMDVIATTLLMAPNWAEGVDDYANMGYWMEDYLEEDEEPIFEGALSTAVFHPEWTFDGVGERDPVHFEKRSPYPTVSLLRKEEMGRKVTEHFERTGGSLSQKIQEENTESLAKAGWDKLTKMLAP